MNIQEQIAAVHWAGDEIERLTARNELLEAVYEAGLEWRASGFAVDYGDKLCEAIAAVQTTEQNDMRPGDLLK